MSTLDAATLLDAWEHGASASPGERGLLLARLARPDVEPNAVERWSVGMRDAELLALRERAFGARLNAVASCPECDEQLEVQFATTDVVVGAAAGAAGGDAPLTLECDGYRVAFRLPSAGDLAQLGAAMAQRAADADGAVRWLLRRCVDDATAGDVPCAADELPGAVVDAVGAAMAGADPQAEIELALSCPACERGWSSPFDIVAFLWREVDVRARELLREVGTLAATFGWSEREILAMSPRRRRAYLELAGG